MIGISARGRFVRMDVFEQGIHYMAKGFIALRTAKVFIDQFKVFDIQYDYGVGIWRFILQQLLTFQLKGGVVHPLCYSVHEGSLCKPFVMVVVRDIKNSQSKKEGYNNANHNKVVSCAVAVNFMGYNVRWNKGKQKPVVAVERIIGQHQVAAVHGGKGKNAALVFLHISLHLLNVLRCLTVSLQKNAV